MLSLKRLIPTLAAAALLGAVAVPAAQASTTQEAIIQDTPLIQSNPVGTVQQFAALGVTRVKITVFWNLFAPQPNKAKPPKNFKSANPAAYPAKNWNWLDAAIMEAQKDHIQVGLQPDAPAPDWAAGKGYQKHPIFKGSWNPSASAFNGFVKALGTRYSGHYKIGKGKNATTLPRVSWWALWNEPNFGFSLQPQTTDGGKTLHSAIEYRALANAGFKALQATGHTPKTDTILIGETAPRGVGTKNVKSWSAYNPGLGRMSLALEFMSQLYCVNENGKPLTGATAKKFSCPGSKAKFRSQNPALFQATGWGIHPYGQGVPPNMPTHDCPKLAFCKGGPSNPWFADFAQIPKVIKLMDHLQSVYGSGKKMQLWNTEFGYWSVPPTKISPSQKGEGISQATAAYYMNWAEYLSYKNPRLMSYSQYVYQDQPGGHWGSGLIGLNGKKKPEYDAYVVPLYMPKTTGSKGASLTVWGGVRPATLLKKQTAQIQFKPGGGASGGRSLQAGTGTTGTGTKAAGGYTTLKTVKITNKRGYFQVKQKFTRSGTVRIAWNNPSGPTVYSRLQKITIK